MKKIVILLMASFMIFGLTGCKPTTYQEISYNDLNKKIENKENFILFIGSETCSACASYKIALNKVIKTYNVTVNYLDISKLSDDENSELLGKFYFSATPTTVFVVDGEEKDTNDRLVGNQKYSKIVKQFKKQGYIKE